MTDCVHNVDFDEMEMVRNRKRKLKMRVGCSKCGNEVTLDHVLSSLASKVYNLNERLKALEGRENDGESLPGNGTGGDGRGESGGA